LVLGDSLSLEDLVSVAGVGLMSVVLVGGGTDTDDGPVVRRGSGGEGSKCRELEVLFVHTQIIIK